MTTSLDEARRYLSLAGDDLAAFRALSALPHIRVANNNSEGRQG